MGTPIVTELNPWPMALPNYQHANASAVEVIESEPCFCLCVRLCALSQPNRLTHRQEILHGGLPGSYLGFPRTATMAYDVM